MLPRALHRRVERVDRRARHAERRGDAFALHHSHGRFGGCHSCHAVLLRGGGWIPGWSRWWRSGVPGREAPARPISSIPFRNTPAQNGGHGPASPPTRSICARGRGRQLFQGRRRPRDHPAHRHQGGRRTGEAPGGAAAEPRHARHQPDRDRPAVLREVQDHPARDRGGRQPAQAAAVAGRRRAAHRDLGGVRPARAHAAAAGLHGAASGSARRPHRRGPLRQPASSRASSSRCAWGRSPTRRSARDTSAPTPG